MLFKVTVLGTSAAIPAYGRALSAHLLESQREYLLIDCGEATQFQLFKFKKKINKINKIFISHLHGDHCFGLPGLLMSMDLMNRVKSICIHGPVGLKQMLNAMLPHPLQFEMEIIEHDCDRFQKIEESENFDIFSFPLKHRIPCQGYLFKEKQKKLKLDKAVLLKYRVPAHQMQDLKNGKDFFNGSEWIKNEVFTLPPDALRSFAYCSDTLYDPSLIDYIKDVNLLYHESTYVSEHASKAKEHMHSTAAQAAQIAKDASVEKLIIGHFSSRYKDSTILLEEALSVFGPTVLAQEGMEVEF